jgi:hypothetical protein
MADLVREGGKPPTVGAAEKGYKHFAQRLAQRFSEGHRFLDDLLKEALAADDDCPRSRLATVTGTQGRLKLSLRECRRSSVTPLEEGYGPGSGDAGGIRP